MNKRKPIWETIPTIEDYFNLDEMNDIEEIERACYAAQPSIDLAHRIADMPDNPTSDEEIKAWAEKLGNDISKGND